MNIQKEIIKKHPKLIHQHQENLNSFLIKEIPSRLEEKKEKEIYEKLTDVKLGKFLPMKFGIRKRLQSDGIEFNMTDMDLHIILFNKVLIQIYDPRKIEDEHFRTEIQEFSEICELFIIIFDFIDFKESSTGEKRALKLQITEYRNDFKFQFIPVELEEELYFIIKSILESPTGRRV
jgi:hypothetical protein